jgi:hypothetical protein
MRGLVFAFGFLLTAALYLVVVSVWFDRPDPSMSTESALVLFAWASGIASVAATLAFCTSLAMSRLRLSPLRCFTSGLVAPFCAGLLTVIAYEVIPRSSWYYWDSPFVPLALLLAVSALIPWLHRLLPKSHRVAG